MKKIILLLLLTAVGVSAQTYSFKKNQSDGKYSQFKSAGGDTTGILVYQVNPISGGSSGDILTKPYLAFTRSTDTWGAAADTSSYDFANNYLKAYVTVYDSSATADTLVFEVYSYAKLGWTTQMIGFKDVVTGYTEADNSTIIIGGTLAKKFEITKYRPGNVRVRPKTVVGRSAFKTKRIVWEGIN